MSISRTLGPWLLFASAYASLASCTEVSGSRVHGGGGEPVAGNATDGTGGAGLGAGGANSAGFSGITDAAATGADADASYVALDARSDADAGGDAARADVGGGGTDAPTDAFDEVLSDSGPGAGGASVDSDGATGAGGAAGTSVATEAGPDAPEGGPVFDVCHDGCAKGTAPAVTNASASERFSFFLELNNVADLTGVTATYTLCLANYTAGSIQMAGMDQSNSYIRGDYVTINDPASLSCASGMHAIDVPIKGALDTTKVKWMELRLVLGGSVPTSAPWVVYVESFAFRGLEAGSVGPFAFTSSLTLSTARFINDYNLTNQSVAWFKN